MYSICENVYLELGMKNDADKMHSERLQLGAVQFSDGLSQAFDMLQALAKIEDFLSKEFFSIR